MLYAVDLRYLGVLAFWGDTSDDDDREDERRREKERERREREQERQSNSCPYCGSGSYYCKCFRDRL